MLTLSWMSVGSLQTYKQLAPSYSASYLELYTLHAYYLLTIIWLKVKGVLQ